MRVERSWEGLQKDEDGLLLPTDHSSLQHAKCHCSLYASSATRIQKGLILYHYVAVAEMDFSPSLMAVVAKHAEWLNSPHSHIKALMSKLESSGDCSLQNGLAEIYICKHVCTETGGSYTVAADESHFRELVLEHAPPPPAIAEFAVRNLIKMGFPLRTAEGAILFCAFHNELKVGGGYTFPRCKARVCELPTECQICGLYPHLFPKTPFNVVSAMSMSNLTRSLPQACFGCQHFWHFCIDCDIYIHDSLHHCSGGESLRHLGKSDCGFLAVSLDIQKSQSVEPV
ncbi:General transcription factor IIH subunit 2 [Ranunculus cassubicifolius]